MHLVHDGFARSKTNAYKQLKQELEELRARTEVLAAEEDELLQKEKEAAENLIAAEHSKGLFVFGLIFVNWFDTIILDLAVRVSWDVVIALRWVLLKLFAFYLPVSVDSFGWAGVAGYSDAQSKLEQISSLKMRLDEQKGATLEEMSQMVEQLNAHIAAKKTELAPLIKVGFINLISIYIIISIIIIIIIFAVLF